MDKHDHDRLVEIHTEMQDLLEEARQLVQREGGIEWERAKSYWLAHVETALVKETRYLGGSMFTMEDTVSALDPGDYDEDECDTDSECEDECQA